MRLLFDENTGSGVPRALRLVGFPLIVRALRILDYNT